MQKILNRYSINILLILAITLFLIACDDSSVEQNIADDKNRISDESKSLNNKGVGEMGYFDYSKATESFEELVKLNPEWDLAKQNLAIARLNRQKPGDEEMAMEMAKQMISSNNNNLVAHYLIGILSFNQGLCEQAIPHFNSIIEKDKNDAYALYFAGQCELQNGNLEKALDLYQDAIKTDSYLRSAYYGGFMAAQRLQKSDLAEEMLNSYQKLDSNPRAKLAEIKYTRMGPKAIAESYFLDKANQPKQQLTAPYFNSPTVLDIKTENMQNYGLVNLQQTQTPQLYVMSPDSLKIFDNYLTSAQELTQFRIDLIESEHQVAWGDINNDNKIDVYITGNKDQLYLQNESGFTPIDMQAFGFNELTSKAVRLADADHDGDLDVLVLNEIGQFEIWNNNLNNTFTALSEKTNLTSNQGFKGIYLQDLDSDRDTDIILYSDYQITLLLNDRMWDYQPIQSETFDNKIKSLSLSDNDINGIPELNLLLENHGIDVIQLSHNKLIKIETLENTSGLEHISLDTNGNGVNEYLLKNSDGLKIVDNQGKLLEQIMVDKIDSIKVLNTNNGPELLFSAKQKLFHSSASDNRLPFILLNLSGKEDDANSVRSNFSGIGTRVVLHSEDFYAIGDSFHNLTGVDQDYQAMNMAAGTNKTNDFIGIDWSDGVYQTELGLQNSQFHKITETQRQLSSCPVIFAWNNGKYEFISDVLGVGGIGFAIGRHEYGQPRPWENYLLTNKQVSSENGVFKFQFTEPMEESAYLDQMQIEVIDVPNKWSVILDERMQISEPIVTGDVLYYESMIKPKTVLNKKNQDVTAKALTTDKHAIDIINQDKRFLGIVDEQIITLEFDEDMQGEYQFIMNGWVEYGYSQTMFAAWQAGIVAQAPTLEYKIDGQWKTLLTEFGYPAGMPRSASVPINLPEKTRFLRIRTNMEIYFDQLALIQTRQPESIFKYTLELQSANLKQLGFPKRQDNRQRVPSYDFSDVQPFWDTRYMQGAYTQIGDITELVSQQDNALAIIGAGEGIEFKFIDNLPSLEHNYSRFYLLKFKGWAKDMDILTKAGETLKPIPFNGLVSDDAKKLNNKYNNRYQAGK